MGKKRRKQILLIVGVLVVLLVTAGVLVLLAPQPPRNELKLAREALNSAQKAGADVYAKTEYRQAQQLYDSAMVNWAVQNERFFLSRDYDPVVGFTEQVILKAHEAETKSVSQAKNTNLLVKRGIADLEPKVGLYERVYKKMPLPASVISAHNKGKMKLDEAKFAFDSGRYNEAKAHLQIATELVKSSNDRAEKILHSWFSNYQHWKKLGNNAVRYSKGGKKVLLIDKYAHKCFVYQSGKQIRQYDVELGMNWMGDKRRKGDKATPEGVYQITQKKDGARTKFHKALLLNYPNDEDRKRFAAEKKNGTLPARTDIGGLIEIHGLGGKGVDWTDGCVALRNSDMDELFRLLAPGTQVIIVGSLKPLSEIY